MLQCQPQFGPRLLTRLCQKQFFQSCRAAGFGCSCSRLDYFHSSLTDVSSIVVVIMMAMVAVISSTPVIPAVPVATVIIRIWLGIRVVRALIVPVWIIIVARRIGITVPRKSKTESPNPWKSRRDLSVSTPPGNEGQSAYRQSNQEKLLHSFTSSICFGFCLLFCAGRLRLPLSRNSDEVGFVAPSKDQK